MSHEIIKVSSKSSANGVAGAIIAVIKESGSAEVQAIGAGAVNQAVKAIAIARTYLKGQDMDIWCTPSFLLVEIEGNEMTAMKFVIKPWE